MMILAIKIDGQEYGVEGELFDGENFDVEMVYKNGKPAPEEWADEIVSHFQQNHEQACIDTHIALIKHREAIDTAEYKLEPANN